MEQLFDFIACTEDAVCGIDGGQRIVLWNAGAQRLLGFESDDVVGRFCYAVLGGTDEEGCPVCTRGCVTQQAAARHKVVPTREMQVRTKAGPEIWVSVTTVVFPSSWRDRCALAHLFRDVTGRRDIESSLELLLRRLETSMPHP